jgi:hypothetical protein
VISASSFIVPYLQFQKERQEGLQNSSGARATNGQSNLAFFLGVGVTSFVVWVTYGRGFRRRTRLSAGIRRSAQVYFDRLLRRAVGY